MSKLESTEKQKLQEMMDDIEILKKYNNELLTNTKGEKLENYINTLGKSINNLEEKVDELYLNN